MIIHDTTWMETITIKLTEISQTLEYKMYCAFGAKLYVKQSTIHGDRKQICGFLELIGRSRLTNLGHKETLRVVEKILY